VLKCLGLIPARGGSKSIRRKNVVELAGRPLIAYTCAAARGSERLTRVIVSTDDPEIASVAADCGVETPFLRPAEIAQDETPMVDVALHALDWAESEHLQVDAVAILQPTSPLRRSAHIDDSIELLDASGADTVVSVVPVPHQFSPGSLMRLDEGGALHPMETGTPVLRRQDKPPLFARNGPAILIVRSTTLRAGRLYGDTIRPLPMTWAESVDIDGPEDLLLAEHLLTRVTASGVTRP
jgi:CMP-N,N'-diacetyllegionaminic acid synthase